MSFIMTHTGQILAEANAAERRVLNEHEGKRQFRRIYDRVAREQAIEDRTLRDEKGVEFAVGQTVVSLCEMWYSKPGTTVPGFMCPGYTGEVKSIDNDKAAIQFEGRESLHFIRRDRMRLSVRVVK